MRLKRKQLIFTAVAGLCVFAGLDLSGALTGNKSIAASVGKMMGDPLSLFGERSPGGRGDVQVQTKQRFASAERDAPGPTERVLAGVREPEAAYAPQAPVLAESPVFAVPPGLVREAPMGDGDFGPRPGPQPPTGPNFIPPARERSGGIPDETILPVEETPVSGVPEPATWLQMIVGMFAVGAMLRRNARRRSRDAAGTSHAS